jgi:hypothetical protein
MRLIAKSLIDNSMYKEYIKKNSYSLNSKLASNAKR